MIKVIYNKVCGRCVQSEPLTSGMVGQPIHFEYSHDFDGLAVTAVFTDGKNTVDVLNPGNQCVIPHEVLDTVGTLVKVGIYATKGNELVIPTVYAAVGIVLKGADPSGDAETDPTLPIWAQLQALIGDLADLETEAKNNLVSAINEAAQTGSSSATIAMRVEGGYIQYTVDGITWSNLIAVADLKGAKGDPGKDGEPGKDGSPGKDGADGITPTIGDNGNWYIGSTDTGKPSRGVAGATGAAGPAGKDGHTPVKGVDYWTAADKSEIVADTAAAIDLTAYAKTADIPTKTSELENDSGFVAASELAAELAGKQDIISDLATIRSGAAKGATALQSVPNSYRTASEQDTIDSGKVDKVTGKGLSSNDYTDAAKAKVDALASVATSGNYNDLTNKPTIPTVLPNPHKLTINGTEYDGSTDVQMTIEGGGSSVPKPLTYDYMPEGYPTKTVQATTLMEEQELAFTLVADAYTAPLTNPLEIVNGQTYIVNWDGTEYECVCSIFNDTILVLGNLSVMGVGDDTGEPFIYAKFPNNNSGFNTLDPSASHTISVKTTAEAITPMAEEFIPSGVTAVMENAQAAANSAQAVANINKEVLDGVFSSVATFTFDKQTSGRDTFRFNAYDYYKISDFNPSPSDVISFKGTRESGVELSGIATGNNCVGYGSFFFIIVASAGVCSLSISETVTNNFTAPSAGLYAVYETDNPSQTAGTGEFTLKPSSENYIYINGLFLKSSTLGSTKKFKITVDDTGTLSATEVTS